MINAQGLSKHYGDGAGVTDLTFAVRPGVVTGFLGPNGSGKSTTIKLMLGLVRGAGRTTFGGRTYAELADPLRTVGVLADPGAVHPARSAAGHLRMIAAGGGLPARRVREVLDQVGLNSVAGKAVGRFSLGMRQRLGLAAALLGDPEHLILDEPANGLDPDGVHWIRGFLRELAAQGRTVFASSHLLAEMALLADDVIVIGAGRLLSAGPMTGFVEAHTRSAVVVRGPAAPQLLLALSGQGLHVTQESAEELVVDTQDTELIARIAGQAQLPIRELFLRRSGLEEAYLAATAHTVQHRGQSS